MNDRSKVDELDLIAAIQRGGWVEHRLTEQEKDLLCETVGAKLLPAHAHTFRGIADKVFGQTVRAEQMLRMAGGTRPKLTTTARSEVEALVGAANDLVTRLENLTDAGRAAIDVAFSHQAENLRMHDPELKFRRVKQRLIDDLDRLILFIGDAQIEVKKGGGDPAYRLMVRSLAGLLNGVTGAVPTRAYLVPETSKSGEGESGLLLSLATLMAQFVNAALPENLRRVETPALTGLVRSEIERLRDME
jgi:hypothetical protein